MSEGLTELAQQGFLKSDDPDALAVALSGAMNELSLWIASQPSPEVALVRARAAVGHRLDSL